ncbi:lachrymatory-factor synthase-like isoform X2 [Physcomitrium patens]|uniref:lachrymatory-factor synthase-like isoform X2 n=1 Tax=Physcomitrium patens TaxID=3218 RepID=UPI00024AF868
MALDAGGSLSGSHQDAALAVASTSCVSSEGKWTGGITGMLLDCPVEAAWELASDRVNWHGWFPGNSKFELREGENRKPGCLRYIASISNVPNY